MDSFLYGVFVYQTGRIFDDNFPVFSFVTNVVKSSLSICIRSAPMFSIHCCSISATIFSFAFNTDKPRSVKTMIFPLLSVGCVCV